MLNPFDLRGPEFLFFYSVLSVSVVFLLLFLRRSAESGVLPSGLVNDPYEIAYLKGGRNHVIAVAVLSLIDRGLLAVKGSSLETVDPDSIAKARRPLERAILSRFLKRTTASHLYDDLDVCDQAEFIGDRLRGARLIPDADQERYRRTLLWIGIATLWSVAAFKIYVAISRGRHNVIFLIILATIFAFAVHIVTTRPFRTSLGQKAMKYLKEFFEGLKLRREVFSLQSTGNELTVLAAVYGMYLLPKEAKAHLKPLKLHPANDGGSVTSSGGDSWYYTSAGDGGGGDGGGGDGGGGGGCGGGCGGCGG